MEQLNLLGKVRLFAAIRRKIPNVDVYTPILIISFSKLCLA